MQQDLHAEDERAVAFRVLAWAFSYPTAQIKEIIANVDWDGLFADLGPWRAAEFWGRPLEEIQAEYTGIFDLGVSEPPCPPYAGLYLPDGKSYPGPRTDLMADLALRYQRWALETTEELPDHIAVELEFMHHLCSDRAESKEQAELQREDLAWMEKHLQAWLPGFCDRLEARCPQPFWKRAGALIQMLVVD